MWLQLCFGQNECHLEIAINERKAAWTQPQFNFIHSQTSSENVQTEPNSTCWLNNLAKKKKYKKSKSNKSRVAKHLRSGRWHSCNEKAAANSVEEWPTNSRRVSNTSWQLFRLRPLLYSHPSRQGKPSMRSCDCQCRSSINSSLNPN